MYLVASGVLFAVFFTNVLMGSLGSGVFLNDVGEFLLLLAVAICFTVAILRAEAKRKSVSDNPTNSEQT